MGSLKLAHHFVIQDVTVIHELARGVLETHDNMHLAAWRHQNGILPGIDFPWLQRDRLTRELVDLVQHLELHQLDVDIKANVFYSLLHRRLLITFAAIIEWLD